jgi:type VI secretion system secreted protein VgrG
MMSGRTRVEARVEIDGIEDPTVVFFDLREAVGQPFDLRLTITGPADTDPSTLLGKDLLLTLSRESASVEERTVGLVTEVTVDERPDGGGDEQSARFELRVQPAIALLELRAGSRIFQDKSVPDIVKSVLDDGLGPYGRSVEVSSQARYASREYCVQYQETDLAFVHRLLDEEGLHYHFDHSGEREVVKIADSNSAFSDIGILEYQAHDLSSSGKEAVRALHPAKRAAITHVKLRDYHFKTAAAPVENEEGSHDPDFGGERREYDHGLDRSMDASTLSARAAVRREAHAVLAAERRGVSNAITLRAGRIFELSGSPLVGADGKYLVTRVVHQSTDRDGNKAESYSADFHCIPSDLPFRSPRVTPRPQIDGIESATVVGPAGEEIHPDEHGRVKVLFPWDREGSGDERSSCWLRVEQPWAGEGWGWMFIPRVGMEVVVHFVDGNPDRPLVTGCLYNGTNVPPYSLPDDKTKSTFKTQSSIGGGGFNEFRFEDKKGQEQVFTHAQKNFDEVVLGNHTTDVGHDQKNTVGGNQEQTIDGDQDETVSGNQGLIVNTHRKIHARANVKETISGGETRIVTGDSIENFDSTETRLVNGGITEFIIGSETHNVGGNKREIITGSHTQTVVGDVYEDVDKMSATHVNAGIDVMCGTAQLHGTTGAIIEADATMMFLAPSSLSITSGSLVDANTMYGQAGSTSVGIHAYKTESVTLKADFTGFKTDVFGFQHSQGALKLSFGLTKTGASSSKTDVVGVLIYQGPLRNIVFASFMVI